MISRSEAAEFEAVFSGLDDKSTVSYLNAVFEISSEVELPQILIPATQWENNISSLIVFPFKYETPPSRKFKYTFKTNTVIFC